MTTPKPPITMPTPEEDEAITAAAQSDPDAQPLTDEQLKAMRPASEVLNIWTMYDSPSDKPGYFVLRRHVVIKGEHGPTLEAYWCKDIEPLREKMLERGLHCIPRLPEDEPHIVEIWL